MNRSVRSAEGTPNRGLYRPEFEHDSCGVGFVANIRGDRSHQILADALTVLARLEHRGGAGRDPLTGDGAGVLFQLPHEFFVADCAMRGITLPAAGRYAVGMIFLPRDADASRAARTMVEQGLRSEGFTALGWRDVPTNPGVCGPSAEAVLPAVVQVFAVPDDEQRDTASIERGLYRARKRIEKQTEGRASDSAGGLYVCTLSSRTICYKGRLLPACLAEFYPDLADARVATAIAVVHQRFSTNTFPSWDRAHPYRLVAHNGEINALRGNVNAMRSREAALASELLGDDLTSILPVIDSRGSDSAMFDNVLELLVQGGRSLPHALLMMIPEAWEKRTDLSDARRAFYEFHASLMEPWDGPAAIAFTDGTIVGALLDRNGLRPFRYVVTTDGNVVMASEAGVLDLPAERIVRRDRVQPGRMFLIDTAAGTIVDDEQLKDSLAAQEPYATWLSMNLVRGNDLPVAAESIVVSNPAGLRARQRAYGYTREDLRMILAPMGSTGEEPVGSMGNDAALAMLSDRPQLLYQYFKQLFAQVTNPPIDPIREALVMSLRTTLGAEQNLLDATAAHCRQIALEHPILSESEFRSVVHYNSRGLRAAIVPALFAPRGGDALRDGLDSLCQRASAAVRDGGTILVLTDRPFDRSLAPIPALLAVGAVHHRLIREGLRTRVSLVVETGEAREVMHFALLLGYGASAVHPYTACETVAALASDGTIENRSPNEAVERYLHAANKGILKTMSKMGISTLQSYRGAQIFEALGLSQSLIDPYFTGTPSRLEGIGLEAIAAECAARHKRAWSLTAGDRDLDVGGQYQWRATGEAHAYHPDAIATLQHAVRSGSYPLFRKYSAAANEETHRLRTLRGLLRFVPGAAVPVDEVEPASDIVKRFKTGAMSFGSISREAHENLAIAMNRIGGRSNSGEGGEDAARYELLANGDSPRSAIKQVASGRFGVTSHYLVNAEELQIKMAQGAKPGEGGQLPGYKVDETIARTRHATVGVGLISPPPHHDIYSIEDLAQLIFDLKNANDRARVSVKLVAEVGVGTIAAGVAKAKADVILISGDSGGTGAAPLSSVKHAGIPWELGLAETQQVLLMNGLRSRVRLETDGQIKTGRDVAIACLLGAEEFGFATAALVASGCVMMRVCHLNTCPVGIATQDPELRKLFPGQPDHVVNFMIFVAEELREIMAALGFRTVDEMVGRVDRLAARDAIEHCKTLGLDLEPLLFRGENPYDGPLRCTESQTHELANGLDAQWIAAAEPALEHRQHVAISARVQNTDRTLCTRLSAEVSRRHGAEGLPPGTISIALTGSAGQSFGAFLAEGLDVVLEGEANDYLAKGMSGGRIALIPPRAATFVPEDNVIAGNVVLYGATRGELFVRGRAGERFAVRNSGAVAVVEGIGDHGCEYMTRGLVIVLGATGRNFAAGMSGGIAYVLDVDGRFESRCNPSMVDLESPDEHDSAELKRWIHAHSQRTGSAVAWRVLSGWRESLKRIVKVMPRDYRKALAARRNASPELTHVRT